MVVPSIYAADLSVSWPDNGDFLEVSVRVVPDELTGPLLTTSPSASFEVEMDLPALKTTISYTLENTPLEPLGDGSFMLHGLVPLDVVPHGSVLRLGDLTVGEGFTGELTAQDGSLMTFDLESSLLMRPAVKNDTELDLSVTPIADGVQLNGFVADPPIIPPFESVFALDQHYFSENNWDLETLTASYTDGGEGAPVFVRHNDGNEHLMLFDSARAIQILNGSGTDVTSSIYSGTLSGKSDPFGYPETGRFADVTPEMFGKTLILEASEQAIFALVDETGSPVAYQGSQAWNGVQFYLPADASGWKVYYAAHGNSEGTIPYVSFGVAPTSAVPVVDLATEPFALDEHYFSTSINIDGATVSYTDGLGGSASLVSHNSGGQSLLLFDSTREIQILDGSGTDVTSSIYSGTLNGKNNPFGNPETGQYTDVPVDAVGAAVHVKAFGGTLITALVDDTGQVVSYQGSGGGDIVYQIPADATGWKIYSAVHGDRPATGQPSILVSAVEGGAVTGTPIDAVSLGSDGHFYYNQVSVLPEATWSPSSVNSTTNGWEIFIGYDSVTEALTFTNASGAPGSPSSYATLALEDGAKYTLFWEQSYRDNFNPGDLKIQLEGQAPWTPGNTGIGDIKEWIVPADAPNFIIYAENTTTGLTSFKGLGTTSDVVAEPIPPSLVFALDEHYFSGGFDVSELTATYTDGAGGAPTLLAHGQGSYDLLLFDSSRAIQILDGSGTDVTSSIYSGTLNGKSNPFGKPETGQFADIGSDLFGQTVVLEASELAIVAVIDDTGTPVVYQGSGQTLAFTFPQDATGWQLYYAAHGDGGGTVPQLDYMVPPSTPSVPVVDPALEPFGQDEHYFGSRDTDITGWTAAYTDELGGQPPSLVSHNQNGYSVLLFDSERPIEILNENGEDVTATYWTGSLNGKSNPFGNPETGQYTDVPDAAAGNFVTVSSIGTIITALVDDSGHVVTYQGNGDGYQSVSYQVPPGATGWKVYTAVHGDGTSPPPIVMDVLVGGELLGLPVVEPIEQPYSNLYVTLQIDSNLDDDGDASTQPENVYYQTVTVSSEELDQAGGDVLATYSFEELGIDPSHLVSVYSHMYVAPDGSTSGIHPGQMIRIVADGAADFGPGFDLDALSKPITVTSLGAAGTETVPDSSEADYVDLRVLSTGDTYYLLDLGVPDGIDEISTLGADKTGSYGLAGFEGFIVAGSDTSSLDTDKTIDIFLSEYQNEVVVVAEGGGLSINLGSDEGSLSDVLSFRGTDTAVNIVLEPNATNNPDGDAYITFTTADGASGATGGTSEVAGADVVLGSEAGDTITGYTTIDNLLAGYGGDDTITGGSANDLLIGGSGDDTLIGGAGSDVLIDLDGNSTGYLQGGEGKDIYVVRDGAHIQGLGVADDALARGSMSTDRYNDRIAFSISTSALLAIVQLDNSIIWPPAGESEVLDYIHLRDLVSMDVSNETGDGQNWTLTASLNYNNGSPQSTVLGTATFSTDQAYQIDDTTGIGSTLKTKVLALDDFLATIHEAVLQQAMVVDQTNEDGTIVEAYGDALSLANAGQPDSISSDLHLLSDSVTLMVGLYEEDAQLVELTPGAPPILLPVIVNGQEVATRFQVGNEDEKIVGGRSGDSYEFVPSAFIDDATDEPVADQSFGLDLILERGRRGDTSQRDTLEFAEYDDPDVSDAGTGLSVHDLLAGTLSLGRDEIGSEGGGRSLLINYFSDADNDGEHDADAPLNETNVGVYKQYYEYTDSFRVEDLQLLDGSGNVAQYDLGVVDGDGNVSTADGRDAILVGSDVADTFTIIKGTAAEQLIEIIMSDFNAIDDRVQIDDEFGAIVTDEANFVTPDEGTSVISDAGPDYRVQMDNNTVDDTTDDVLLDFYFTVTVPADAEFEATVSTVTLTTA